MLVAVLLVLHSLLFILTFLMTVEFELVMFGLRLFVVGLREHWHPL